MTQEEAVAQLKAAGLRTHNLDQYGIIGGGWVDRSSGLGMIQDCYSLKPNPDGSYETKIENLQLTQNMSLAEAVTLIIKSIKPGVNIEPPRRGNSNEPQEY